MKNFRKTVKNNFSPRKCTKGTVLFVHSALRYGESLFFLGVREIRSF